MKYWEKNNFVYHARHTNWPEMEPRVLKYIIPPSSTQNQTVNVVQVLIIVN